jgi:phosphotriesterase-related protein
VSFIAQNGPASTRPASYRVMSGHPDGDAPSARPPDTSAGREADAAVSPGDVGQSFAVQTVSGPIPSEALGITSTHEHMIVDMLNWSEQSPLDPSLRDAPIILRTLGRVRRNPLANRENLVMNDPELAAQEVADFRLAGGTTIVDVTNADFGRDPEKLREIAATTGLNIVMGSGYYVESAHPPDMDKRTVEDCTETIVADITKGADGTDIRAGIIGEIGCSGSITKNEEKALRAAAWAQSETGSPISVHQPVPFEKRALKALDILASEGADLSHVVVCHMDHTLEDQAYHKAVADRGCILEFDRFGNEWYYDSKEEWREWRDRRRAQAIAWLVRNGYGGQVVLGQDICYRINLKRYGGWGYGHILKVVPTMLEEAGLVKADLERVFVDNPRRLLAFRKPLTKAEAAVDAVGG